MDIRRSPDAQTLAQDAASFIAGRIESFIESAGRCHLALAGGSTPRATYEVLREMPVDWSRLHIWYSDERCLRKDDAARNDAMARAALLDHVPLPASQIHAIPAELGPVAGAKAYADLLLPVGRLDIVLLGLGEDGHTASLFPGNPALEQDEPAVPVFDAPKPPAERVSLSLPTIRRARERIFLVAGHSKREALRCVMESDSLPATRVGEAIWFVDRQASSE